MQTYELQVLVTVCHSDVPTCVCLTYHCTTQATTLTSSTMNTRMPLREALRLIAQGAVNISEGHTTIESGSPIHRAMYDLLDHINDDTWPRVPRIEVPPANTAAAVADPL